MATIADSRSLIFPGRMKHLPLLLLATLCAAALTPACRKATRELPPAAAQQDPHIVKVWVTKDGVVELNGKVADLPAIEAALTAAAKIDGVVFYGRDDAREHPHPTGAKVVEMIAAHHLPVRLSSKPDFSDEIRPQK